MAYDDSEALQPNSTYSLGGYTFELKVQNVHEPGEPDVVSVFAICRSPDGTRETVPMDFPAGTTVESWTVEANETEASVYAKIRKKEHGPSSYVYLPQISGTTIGEVQAGGMDFGVSTASGRVHFYVGRTTSGSVKAFRVRNPESQTNDWVYVCSDIIGQRVAYTALSGRESAQASSKYLTEQYDGIYYARTNRVNFPWNVELQQYESYQEAFEDGKGTEDEILVARFAIDLSEADGGPDGDWDEPGDTGDPSYTLNVHVTGASSGSNNGTPLEPGQTGGYGNGGIGGNGGGGGAGASTVIIYEFATNKAGTVNQEATAQDPGTGGPGGKGGKGGDGCILIFY